MFENYSNIRFHKNRFRVGSFVPCRLADRLSKLVVVFRNFANAPNEQVEPYRTEKPLLYTLRDYPKQYWVLYIYIYIYESYRPQVWLKVNTKMS